MALFIRLALLLGLFIGLRSTACHASAITAIDDTDYVPLGALLTQHRDSLPADIKTTNVTYSNRLQGLFEQEESAQIGIESSYYLGLSLDGGGWTRLYASFNLRKVTAEIKFYKNISNF